LVDYAVLFDTINNLANILKNWISSKTLINIIASNSADGIIASTIISDIIFQLEGRFHLKFLDEIYEDWINDYLKMFNKKFEQCYYVFLDCGNDSIHYLTKYFPKKRLMILDHTNLPENFDNNDSDLYCLDLESLNIDGNKEISTSAICYYILKELVKNNREIDKNLILKDYLILSIVGALGDHQDTGKKHSLLGINNLIFEECKNNKYIIDEENLRFFRRNGPIIESISETIEPYLINLTNNIDNVRKLLLKLGIPTKISIDKLDKKMKTELNSTLIEYIYDYKDLAGINYIIQEDSYTGYLKDAREFSIILNSCGFLKHSDIGFELCLGNRGSLLKNAINLYKKFREMIPIYLDWISTPDNILETRYIQCILGNKNFNNKILEYTILLGKKLHILRDDKLISEIVYDSKNEKIFKIIYIPDKFINKNINFYNIIKETNNNFEINSEIFYNQNEKYRCKIIDDLEIKSYLNKLNSFIDKHFIKE